MFTINMTIALSQRIHPQDIAAEKKKHLHRTKIRMVLNQRLIKDFRDKMNESLVLHVFRDRNGRAEWNVICSAVDWIETAVEGIDTDSLSRENSSLASIRMITFISCVDILWNGVLQLHRVFADRDTEPFKTDSTVFNARCSDNIQWKTIRAIFAAHPVELRNVYGGGERERWFASWSGGTFSHGDFGVFLYSNKPGVQSRVFDIQFADVFRFAEKRYLYLNDLMTAADDCLNEYKRKQASQSIDIDKENVLEWIEKLIIENHQRWNNDTINYNLESARDVFQVVPRCDTNRKALEQYKPVIILQLEQIHQMLQNMDLDSEIMDVEGDYPETLMHPIEKLFTAEYDDPIFRYGVDAVQNYLGDVVDLNVQETVKEIQTIARAGLWAKDKQQNSKDCEKPVLCGH